MQLSAKREEVISSIRKKNNEELFKKRRLKAMQKLDNDRIDENPGFTMEDVVNGTAFEAICRSKTEKLKKAIQNDKFAEILQIVTFFRRRLSLVKEDNLICSQVRQLDIIPEFISILKKYEHINDDTRKIFEEASWAMANFCSGSAHNIEFLVHHDFFEVVMAIFEHTTELELFQNVVFVESRSLLLSRISVELVLSFETIFMSITS